MKKILINTICLLILLATFDAPVFAQNRRRVVTENLPKFDRRMYHFGFLLGMNQMNFAIKTVEDFTPFDSLTNVLTKPDFGFDIGIVSSLRLTKYLSLRFVPTLSFGNRTVEYSFRFHDSISYTQSKKIESTFMTFPIYLKYSSKRIGNFSAYIIGGAKYSIDMASQAKKKNKEGEAPIKLARNDYMIDVGTGVDFYLPYFKFGIELKMSYGLRNLLIPENTTYTNSVRRLNSKIFQLSFTFEG